MLNRESIFKNAAVIAITVARGKSMKTTADQKEIDNFAAVSGKWWDEAGPMAPLHKFAPVRIDYILQSVRRRNQHNPPPKDASETGQNTGPNTGQKTGPIGGLRVLDIGCGGGILAEPMARLGGTVTGIDITPEAIDAATTHAAASGLDIRYACSTAEAFAANCQATAQKFDLIYASEVIEHVTDRRYFAEAIAAMLADRGTVVITTINRSLPALVFAKFALEYVVRLVPPGTHDPEKFVKPSELRADFAAAGIALYDMTGFVPHLTGGFRQSGNMAINYGASGGWA